MGLDFSRASKTLFLTKITQILIKWTSKTAYSYSARRDLSIGAWFDFIRKKIFLAFFDQRGVPNQEKWPKLSFFKYGQITYQLIDLVELSKNMWFLRFIWLIFGWFGSETVFFLRLLKSLKFIIPNIRGQIKFFNIQIYSKFNAELKYFYRIVFTLFFFDIFKL